MADLRAAADDRARRGIPEPSAARDHKADAETAAWVAANSPDDVPMFRNTLGTPDSLVMDALATHLSDDCWADSIEAMLEHWDADDASAMEDALLGRTFASAHRVRVTDDRVYAQKRQSEESDFPCLVHQTVGHSTRTYTVNVRVQRAQRHAQARRQNGAKGGRPQTATDESRKAAARERQRKARERKRKGTFATL